MRPLDERPPLDPHPSLEPSRAAWRARLGAKSAVLLVVVTVMAAAGAATYPWAGERFTVFCGRSGGKVLADYASGQRPDGYEACICGGDPRAEPAEKGFLDSDQPPGPCLTPERRDNIEAWAAEAFQSLMANGFASPSPQRLGPIVTDYAGQEAVRLYADRHVSANYAATFAPCSGGRYADVISKVRFRPGQFGRAGPNANDTFSDPAAYRMLAHELVHVIQYAQPFIPVPAGDCPEPLWIVESAADAMSAQLVKRRFPGFKPQLSPKGKGSRSVYGIRPYNRALSWVDDILPLDRDRYGNALVPHYTLSSFWTYLAERFSGGDFTYLARMYDAPGGGNDWLAWLDERLEAVVNHPLYVIYPDFVAHYAQWGAERYPHLGEDIWLRESFPQNGAPCTPVELSTGSPKDHVTLDFEPISARCLRVTVVGLAPGHPARVGFMTYAQSKKSLDNLHLSIAYSTEIAVDAGQRLDCYSANTQGASGQPCLVKKAIGEAMTKGPHAGLHPATWWSDKFQTDPAGQFEILYLVSHVPHEPKDRLHDKLGTAQSADFTIALHETEIATARGDVGPDASAAVNGVPESDTPPMSGMDAGAGGGLAAVMNPQMAFPGAVPGNAPVGDGIRLLTLSDAQVGTMPGSGLDIRLQLIQRPITFGATGSYRAYVLGTDRAAGGQTPAPGVAMPGGAAAAATIVNVPADDTIGSATIDVVEFSDDLLHLQIDGLFCRGSNLNMKDGTCLRAESFQAEILRPFGWTYDHEQQFVSIDSPGLVEYRKYLPYVTGGLIPSVTNAPQPTPSGGGSQGAGAGAGAGQAGVGVLPSVTCNCSCQEYQQLQAISQALSNSPGRTGPPAGDTLARLDCVMTCSAQYTRCIAR